MIYETSACQRFHTVAKGLGHGCTLRALRNVVAERGSYWGGEGLWIGRWTLTNGIDLVDI